MALHRSQWSKTADNEEHPRMTLTEPIKTESVRDDIGRLCISSLQAGNLSCEEPFFF